MISVPGKIFIFGEYSVMHGGEAILASVNPVFECSWSTTTRVHPKSPAGAFLEENGTQVFTKVEGGLGAGFGSSTAELISANEFLEQPWLEKKLWTWYRASFAPASGADLVIQNHSRTEGCGFYHFQIRGEDYQVNRVEVPTNFLLNCFIFHAPYTKKIPTHVDLEEMAKNTEKDPLAHFDFQKTNFKVHEWLRTFNPKLLTEWAEYLSSLGLESVFAHQVRSEFQSIPGVLGVKGCGAGLNDVFLVQVDQSHATIQKQLSEVAEKFYLKSLGTLRDHV